MMTRNLMTNLIFKVTTTLAWGGILLAATEIPAQTSSLLALQTIQAGSGDLVQIQFSDQGTGATNYLLQFTPALGTAWTNVSDAVIVDEGGGAFQAVANHPASSHGFYRVLGLGGVAPAVTAGFSLTTLDAEEGTTAVATIVFSQPFFGTVHYTVNGTAHSGDYLSLSGEVTVNGTTATIPISLTDNEAIGQLKYLTLTLNAGPGYELGAASRSTINILENDADWQGSLLADEAALGFVLRIQQSNGVHNASLRSDRLGFFPTNETPASITLNDNFFAATAQNVPLPAEATLFNAPMNLTLSLLAQNGVTNQSVTPTQIEGEATLITQVPDASYLNTTNTGTFRLIKPPVSSSTNEVQLSSQ